MGTIIRPELSEGSKYWIEKHRYYELKHFCLQYPIWKKAYEALDDLSIRHKDLLVFKKTNAIVDPVGKCVEARAFYFERMDMIERVVIATDESLASYILRGVTEGISYNRLEAPCCRNIYYELYRKFFWLLNTSRNKQGL